MQELFDSRNGAGSGQFTPEPLDLARYFSGQMPRPRYIVNDVLARGEVGILSGDTGACKTWLKMAMAVAITTGRPWLGHTVEKGSVLFVDEENPNHVVVGRLRALGMPPEALPDLRYFSQNGAQVGDRDATDAWLEGELEAHAPVLVIIDTVTAAGAVSDLNSNSEAGDFYRQLKPLAKKYDCAFLLSHHQRKPKEGGGNDPGMAMMGARQWAGQADVHLAIAKARSQPEPEFDGDTTTNRLALRLSCPKMRNGKEPPPQPLTLTITTDTKSGALVSADLELGDLAHDLAARLAESLEANGQVRTRELAGGVGLDASNSSFKRALKQLVDEGRVKKAAHGVYEYVDASQEDPPI